MPASFFGDADIPLEGLSKPFYKIVCDASAREPVLMILGSRCVQYSGQGSTASATDDPDTNEVDAGLTSCGCCPVALAFTLAVVSKRPATVQVDLADLAQWFGKVRMGPLGHSSKRNHQYHSNCFGEPRDHRIPCAERYGRGTRHRHTREVVCYPALRL